VPWPAPTGAALLAATLMACFVARRRRGRADLREPEERVLVDAR
jgi:hypothetical protein